jgi:hypothetical protein
MDDDDSNQISRRWVVGSAGIGLAAAATPALGRAVPPPQTAQPLQDPKKKYPAPPYARQSQPWPGLASKMEPPPVDSRLHGATAT